MKILLVHNFYQQPGGEDGVFEAELNLLEAKGHNVFRHTVHNDSLVTKGQASMAIGTIWNHSTFTTLKSLLDEYQPDVVHFHNTFPLISPSAYYAVKSRGIPIVQTLHNYRILCPNAEFFRNGKICEDCLGKLVPWPGITHGCYRGDRVASAAVGAMLTTHRILQTWDKQIDYYIALTNFAKNKFVQGGLDSEKILVKPNFVAPDPQMGSGSGNYALFVGRLAPEKGIPTLLAAWQVLRATIPLKIVGDGPLAHLVQQATQDNSAIHWLGRMPLPEVYKLMGEACFLVFPSEWYEGLPRTIVESFAKGTPVIASKIGSLAEIVEHDVTGRHFKPGHIDDLVTQVKWAMANPSSLAAMRTQARISFEKNYTAEKNYEILSEIYLRAVLQNKN